LLALTSTPIVRAGPAFSAIATALFYTTVISLVFALASGEHFSSYYIFYGSLFFGVVYISGLRELHLRVTGWMLAQAGYTRRALLVGSGRHIEAVHHALTDQSRMRVDIAGYISLTPRPPNGLRSLGTLEQLPEVLGRERIQEVIIADPEFPPGAGGRACGPLPPARRDRAGGSLDDGDPDRPGRVHPRTDGAAVQAPPAGGPGDRLRAEADVRTSSCRRSA